MRYTKDFSTAPRDRGGMGESPLEKSSISGLNEEQRVYTEMFSFLYKREESSGLSR